jgi:CRISPR-associated endonuclease cas3-HD
MENIYYARSANEQGQKETVFHHLSRASELCQEFLSPLGYGAWGEVLGKFHDFGKYSEDFQQVLRREKTHVNHAGPGAALVFQAYGGWSHGGKGQNRAAKLLASVIASHHGELSLVDDGVLKRVLRGEGDRLDSEGRRFSLFGQEEFRDAVSLWKSAFTPPRLSPPLPAFSDGEDASLARMLWTRFLFSALVDADYSSAAEHQKPDYLLQNQGPELDPEEALQRLSQVQAEKKQGSTAASTLNVMRNQLFDDCLAAAAQEPGLFTLTAPTGLGKTLSLFAFAAEHCRIYGKRRIILILPFLAIIEQNVKDYRKVVPDLLEIHSNAQLDERARLLSERWDAPCIVTTSVGFFQPLFSAKPADCRHLHQLANSVLVLDEAQSLPPHLLDATLRTVKLLCTQYGCTVVFSTATQPSFGYRPGLSWQPREIAPDPAALFAATRRVTVDWRLKQPISLVEIAGEVAQENQACAIVNLRAHARALYRQLVEQTGAESTFFLTTDLCPAHRLAVLRKIRERMQAGLPCRLVSTQCIEAGVDLDFPVVFRALAPLDAIIQAAGRCNRNGDSPTGRVIVFVPEEEKLYPSSAYENAANCVRVLASRHPIDCNDLSHIQEYYQLLYSQSEGDKQALRQAVEAEDFLEVQHAYQIIENTGLQVVVPCPGEEKLYQEVKARYEKEGLTPALMRLAGPITVSSFQRDLVRQYCVPLYYRAWEHGGTAVETGYYLLGIPDCYDRKQGIVLENVQLGMF